MSKIVFVFGAGASADAGGPLMSNFIDKAGRISHFCDDWEKEYFDIFFKALYCLQKVHYKSRLDIDNIESVYGALEMAVLCGHLEGFDNSELDRLLPAVRMVIAKTIEGSISFPNPSDSKPIIPYEEFINSLVSYLNTPTSISFLTFNYDLCLEYAFNKYNIKYNYCLDETITNDEVPLLKLHGSLNWFLKNEGIHKLDLDIIINNYYNLIPIGNGQSKIHFKHPSRIIHESDDENISKDPIIVPPSWSKGEFHKQIQPVWKAAMECLRDAEAIFFIGYSMPESDAFFRYLFALALLEEQVVVARGIEGRIQVDQIHRFVPDAVAQDVQVVAVEECVHMGSLKIIYIIL